MSSGYEPPPPSGNMNVLLVEQAGTVFAVPIKGGGNRIVLLSQEDYDLLSSYDTNTLYCIPVTFPT